MRQKAEAKIKQAAAALGPSDLYRIDQVRAGTDLIRKVFDKTLLDMARLEVIELKIGDTEALSPPEIDNMVRYLDEVYVHFRFLDKKEESRDVLTPVDQKTIKPELVGLEREQWQQFEFLCEKKEGKAPVQKLCELIKDYIGDSDSGK